MQEENGQLSKELAEEKKLRELERDLAEKNQAKLERDLAEKQRVVANNKQVM